MDDGMDSNGEKLYMSDDFIKMMWGRTLFLGDVLKRGYSFIFTVRFNLIKFILFFDNNIYLIKISNLLDLEVLVNHLGGVWILY